MSDRITYVGHATVLIELAGVRLLSDPMLRSRLLHIRRAADPPDPAVATGIDAVLVSHMHPDHLDFPSLRRLGREVRVIVPARGRGWFRRRGFAEVTELWPGDSTRVGPVEVRATHAAHRGRRYPLGRRVPALGFDLRGGGRRVYFAGDTATFEGMRKLAGGIDIALLPIAGWAHRVSTSHHLDPRTAAEAAAILRPRIVVPIHWGTLLRADLIRRHPELLTDPPREFAAEAAELAPEVDVRVLAPGGSQELDSIYDR
ncbi:MAG: MBL fold metallo-hydrolase [Solirubrobacterales bacterium]